jgi:protein of hypothetical function DUF445
MIASWITERLQEILTAALETENPRHHEGVQALSAFFASLGDHGDFRVTMRRAKEHLIEDIDMESILADFIESRMKGNHPFWIPYVREFLHKKIEAFAHSAPWQSRVDRWMKSLAEGEVEKHHGMIARFVRDYLNQKSDDELVLFVEGKVRTDLQMIRINGAVVGAAVGMALSLIVCMTERMWGL